MRFKSNNQRKAVMARIKAPKNYAEWESRLYKHFNDKEKAVITYGRPAGNSKKFKTQTVINTLKKKGFNMKFFPKKVVVKALTKSEKYKMM
jgi:hypothetical protein